MKSTWESQIDVFIGEINFESFQIDFLCLPNQYLLYQLNYHSVIQCWNRISLNTNINTNLWQWPAVKCQKLITSRFAGLSISPQVMFLKLCYVASIEWILPATSISCNLNIDGQKPWPTCITRNIIFLVVEVPQRCIDNNITYTVLKN